MGKVEIDKEINGEKITRFLARQRGVQAELKAQALKHALKAERLLGEHRSDRKGGHSYIKVSKGDIDHYVELNDTRGDWAAAAIEYGRLGEFMPDDGGVDGSFRGPMKGLFILHRAFGLKGH